MYLTRHYKFLTNMLICGVACELTARAMEGKPLPGDLSGAEFPRDPFTGKPFELIRRSDEVILRSPGVDLVFAALPEPGKSGFVSNISTSGRSLIIADDIVFVLQSIQKKADTR
jgi:hypothetical protein